MNPYPRRQLLQLGLNIQDAFQIRDSRHAVSRAAQLTKLNLLAQEASRAAFSSASLQELLRGRLHLHQNVNYDRN